MGMRHPHLPFIEVGSERERVARLGLTEHQIAEACIHLDDWWFSIDGDSAGCAHSCFSAEDALERAEAYLFDPEAYGNPLGRDFVQERIKKLIASGEVATALALAEIRGQWTGRSQVVSEVRERHRNATKELSICDMKRCTQASRRTFDRSAA